MDIGRCPRRPPVRPTPRRHQRRCRHQPRELRRRRVQQHSTSSKPKPAPMAWPPNATPAPISSSPCPATTTRCPSWPAARISTSVPQGGNYDGAAGVVAGLLALARFRADGFSPARTIKLYALRGEESAWFGRAYIGSSALFGNCPPTTWRCRTSSPAAPCATAWPTPASPSTASPGAKNCSIPPPSPPGWNCISSKAPCWSRATCRSPW